MVISPCLVVCFGRYSFGHSLTNHVWMTFYAPLLSAYTLMTVFQWLVNGIYLLYHSVGLVMFIDYALLTLSLFPFIYALFLFFRVWPCLIGHFTHWGVGVMFLDLTQHLFFTVTCSYEHSPRSSLKGSWDFFFSALQLLNHGRTRKRSLSGWGIRWWGAGRVCVSLLVLYCKCYTLR